MFNSNSWQSHAEYRINFKLLAARFDSDSRQQLWNLYPVERAKLMSLNLDPVGEYVSKLYSPQGRPATNQAQILRSLILFAMLFNRTDGKLSLTLWVRGVLPRDIVLVALVGCRRAGELPPLGSYYDFMNRLCPGSRKEFKRSALLPANKNGKKPKKEIGADGKLVEPEPETFRVRDMVQEIYRGSPLSDGRADILQDVFFLAAVLPSWQAGLIPHDGLTCSGDGTAVPVHASPFGRRQKHCSKPSSCPFRKDCPRHYSDPEASWGWDSHLKQWYFGRTLYMIGCHNRDLKVDLPLLMNFTSAKRHDSINFLYAMDAFGRHCAGLNPANVCLDSAHDNIPTYELLERWGINALIDLNMRGSSCEGIPEDVSLDKQGFPHCRAGHRMCAWGYDKNKGANKYRCPLKCERLAECPHSDDCSRSGYGRTVYINKGNSLRFYPRIPRDSEQYRSIYAERTACERLNNRVLNDYHLQNLKIRGDSHYSFWTMVIGICIHLDARKKTNTL